MMERAVETMRRELRRAAVGQRFAAATRSLADRGTALACCTSLVFVIVAMLTGAPLTTDAARAVRGPPSSVVAHRSLSTCLHFRRLCQRRRPLHCAAGDRRGRHYACRRDWNRSSVSSAFSSCFGARAPKPLTTETDSAALAFLTPRSRVQAVSSSARSAFSSDRPSTWP